MCIFINYHDFVFIIQEQNIVNCFNLFLNTFEFEFEKYNKIVKQKYELLLFMNNYIRNVQNRSVFKKQHFYKVERRKHVMFACFIYIEN